MANHAHPLEDVALDLHAFASDLIRHFMEDDELDPKEHALISRLVRKHQRIQRINSKRRLLDHLERSDSVTDYTQRLARMVDLELVDLNKGKEDSSNIVPFPPTTGARNG